MDSIKDYKEVLKDVYNAMDDKFATDITILDIKNVSSITDYFVIANGSSPNQVKAIADAASESLYKRGEKARHSEGYQTASWVLLDFYNIVVHVFNKEDRQFYNLERLWGDAKTVDINNL